MSDETEMTRGSWREGWTFRWLRLSQWRLVMSDKSKTTMTSGRGQLRKVWLNVTRGKACDAWRFRVDDLHW